MPELPEVEVTRLGVAPSVIGRRVVAVTVREPRLRWPVPAAIRTLAGRTVRSVVRRAKYLVFDCDGRFLIVHLGMSGSLRLVRPEEPAGKHDHVDISFGDTLLRLRDPRRFGAMLVTDHAPAEHPLLRSLGPEPLDENFDAAWLHRMAAGRRIPIKQLLMDAHCVVGVGNIYASESLFLAGVDPRRSAGRLSRERCGKIVAAIRKTLAAAIRAGGSSLRDFVGSDGRSGYFQQDHWVYDRAGSKCRRCDGTVRRLVQGQRATFYCPRCQR